jgi:hypothetical protein
MKKQKHAEKKTWVNANGKNEDEVESRNCKKMTEDKQKLTVTSQSKDNDLKKLHNC